MLASWSMVEMMSSGDGWARRCGRRETERLRKSWVVEGPITGAGSVGRNGMV